MKIFTWLLLIQQQWGVAQGWYELQFRRRDGESVHGLFSAEPFETAGRQYLLAAIIDITERRAAELKLGHERQRLGIERPDRGSRRQ
jgi:PAS domain-containing protein